MTEFLYQTLAKIGYTHPLHPVLTHVVMGMVIGGFVFGLVAWLFRRPNLAQTGRHCMGLALIALFPTALVGYMDWQHRFSGAWLFPIKIKIILAAVLLVLLVAAVVLGSRARKSSKNLLIGYLLCLATVIGIRRDSRNVLLLLWVACLACASIFSFGAPNMLRTLGMVPAVVLILLNGYLLVDVIRGG